MVHFMKSQCSTACFYICTFLFKRVESIAKEGIGILFLRNTIKKLFTAQKPCSFVGKSCTNILSEENNNLNMLFRCMIYIK